MRYRDVAKAHFANAHYLWAQEIVKVRDDKTLSLATRVPLYNQIANREPLADRRHIWYYEHRGLPRGYHLYERNPATFEENYVTYSQMDSKGNIYNDIRLGRTLGYCTGARPQYVPGTSYSKPPQRVRVRSGILPDMEYINALIEQDSAVNFKYGLLFILAISSLTVYSIILAG